MTSSNRYKKVGGAAGLTGQKYEYKMASLLYLRGVNHTSAFHMGTNVAGAGAFDDVVFKYKLKGEDEFRTCFLQFKHKSSSKNRINIQNLVDSKGDFSLCKYFNSFCKIAESVKENNSGVLFDVPFSNCDFILYSNVRVDKLMKERFRDRLVERDRELFGTREDGCMFSLSSDVDSDVYSHTNLLELGDGIKEFLPRLQLFAEQASEDQLDSLIVQEIKTALQTKEEDSKKITKMFIEKIQQWWEETGESEVLTETAQLWSDVIASRLDLINDSKKKEMKALNISFTDQEIDSFNQYLSGSLVINVTSPHVQLTSMKISQVLEKHHSKRFIFMDEASLLSRKAEVLRTWQSVWCDVLVIECSTDAKSLAEALSKTSTCKKLIILSQTALPGYQQLCDIFTWNQLDVTSQNILLEKGVNFQGHDASVRSVVGGRSTHALTGDVVLQLLTSGLKLSIGRKLSDVIPYYIPRSLERHDCIMVDAFLKHEFKDDYFIISNIAEQDIAQYQTYSGLKMYKYDKTDRKLQHNFYWIEESLTTDEFHRICEKVSKKNVHWLFKGTDMNLFWRQSFNSMSVIKQYVSKTSKRTCSVDVDQERVVFLTAEPGMGKSCLSTHLAQEAKAKDNSQWVIRVNLNDVATKIQNQGMEFCEDNSNVIEFLLSLENIEHCNVGTQILRSRLTHTGNVTIILEGFDEICPHLTDPVIAMIKSLTQLKVTSLWVTSRNVMQSHLENQLNSICYSIKPFDRDDQTYFLCRYWNTTRIINIDEETLKKLAVELIDAASKSLGDKNIEISVIPLQCLMLAEAFADDLSTGALHLPPKLDVLSLYETFVDKKMEILLKDKDGIDISNPRQLALLRREKENMLKDHSEAAISLLVSNEDIPLLGNIDDNIEARVAACFADSEERTGLVDGIVSGKPSFIHRTFAEYFLAMWLSSNVSSISSYIEKQLLEPGFATVRVFFDRLLARGLPLHNAVLSSDYEEVKRLLTSGTHDVNGLDLGGRSALHLAASYSDISRSDEAGIVQMLLSHGANASLRDKILLWTPLRYADKTMSWANVEQLLRTGGSTDDLVEVRKLVLVVKPGSRALSMLRMCSNSSLQAIVSQGGSNILEFILDDCKLDTNIDIFPADEKEESTYTNGKPHSCKSTLLHATARSGNAEAARILIERGADVKIRNYSMLMAVDLAAQAGHLDVLRLLVESGGDLETSGKKEMNPLHFATQSGHLDIVQWLSQSGADLNSRAGYNKMSPLHFAAEAGCLDIVKWLWQSESVTSLDPKEKADMTPLHYAAGSGHLDVVKWLIDAGADPKAKNAADWTTLHLSVNPFKLSAGHSDVTKWLIREGAELNAVTEFGSTALHLSVCNGHIEASRWLIEAGADVNIVEEDRRMTPLQMAAGAGHVEIVKCLLQARADVNAKGILGYTALHLCVATGYTPATTLSSHRGTFCRRDSQMPDTSFSKRTAVSSEHVQAAKLLIEAGADPHCVNDEGNTPLYLAWLSGLNDLLKWFVIKYKLDDLSRVLSKQGDKNKKDENGMSDLHYAALVGQLEAIKYLLADGADVNATDKNNATPLHYASQEDDESIVKHLIENGANINAKDKIQRTPLHLAAKVGNERVVKCLLEAKPDLNVRDKQMLTPLLVATKAGFSATVKCLLEVGADVNARDKNARTSLHHASYKCHDATIKYLAEAGADMNARDKDGKSPLNSAYMRNNMDTVKLLVELGSDVNAMGRCGTNILHSATQRGDLEAVQWLLQAGADMNSMSSFGRTALDMCVQSSGRDKGKATVAKWLIHQGIRIDTVDDTGSSILHHFLRSRQFDVARCLVDAGADWYFPDYNGETPFTLARKSGITLIDYESKNNPLHLAALSGDLDEVKMLISQGVKIHDVDKHGKCPLHYGVLSGQLEIVTCLLDAGADVNRIDANRMSALHYASIEGHEGIVRRLVKEGCDINAKDKNLYTPLHYASQEGHTEIAECLVDSGADLNAKNWYREIPLNSANQRNHMDVMKLLVKRGSDVNAPDRWGAVSMHSAATLGDVPFVNLLLDAGAHIGSRNCRRETPLHRSVNSSHIGLVKYLIEVGADVNAADGSEQTPLLCSLYKEQVIVELSKYLIEVGADVNAVDGLGQTPLLCSLRNGQVELAKYLIEFGADVNFIATNVIPALFMCLLTEQVDLAKYLIDAGADVNCVHSAGISALIRSLMMGQFELAKSLIDAGADVNGADSVGFTALLWTLRKGEVELAMYLIEAGADPYCTSKYGDTPLSIATQHKLQEFTDWFAQRGNATHKHNAPVQGQREVNFKTAES